MSESTEAIQVDVNEVQERIIGRQATTIEVLRQILADKQREIADLKATKEDGDEPPG